MTDQEAVESVRRGERVASTHSLHAQYTPGLCPGSNHALRTLFCWNSELDVCECSRCGFQCVTNCDFDEDFA